MGHLTGGVLHSKFWIVDGRHVYVGSANMDWRSLTQVSPGVALPALRGLCLVSPRLATRGKRVSGHAHNLTPVGPLRLTPKLQTPTWTPALAAQSLS